MQEPGLTKVRTTRFGVPAPLWLAGVVILLLIAIAQIPAGASHDPSAPNLLFAPVAACRVVDTRLVAAGMFAAGETRTFVFRGPTTDFSSQGGNAVGCGVPDLSGGDPQSNLAKALMLNITAVTPRGTDVGSVKAWPSNQAEPLPSLVYFQKGGKIFGIANGISVPMCDEAATDPCQSGDIAFKVVDSSVHLVVDVVGYFH